MATSRPVLKVGDEPQLSLLDRPLSDEQDRQVRVKCQDADAELIFQDPDPEAIFFGNQSLRSYLEAAGLESGFLIRDVLRSLDWSRFEAKYSPGGRPPYAPSAMMGIVLYGLINGVTSLRGLETMARKDLVCQWISGGIFPDHATLGRFVNLHADTIPGHFFEELTRKVIECLPEVDRELSGDGTTIEAAASRYKGLKLEAAEQLAEETEKRAKSRPDNAECQREAAKTRAAAEEVRQRAERRRQRRHGDPKDMRINLEEPDAYFHRLKDKRWRFAYIPSIVANRQRIIVGQTVDPAREIDVVEQQLDQAERTIGPPDRLMLDANYFCFDIVELAVERNIDLLCPSGDQVTDKQRSKFPKSAFDYDPATNTLECPAGEVMEQRSAGYDSEMEQKFGYYETPACNEGCPLRDQCTESARGRRIKRWEHDTLKDAARWVMEQPRAQQAYRHRNGSVEPVFNELRHIQQLERFRRQGTKGVTVEFALHAAAHNLRRLKAILDKTDGTIARVLKRLIDAIWVQLAAIRRQMDWASNRRLKTDTVRPLLDEIQPWLGPSLIPN